MTVFLRTEHIARFGAREIPRSAYLDLLAGEMARMAVLEEGLFDYPLTGYYRLK